MFLSVFWPPLTLALLGMYFACFHHAVCLTFIPRYVVNITNELTFVAIMELDNDGAISGTMLL